MRVFILIAIAIGAATAAEIFRGKPELDNHWENFKSKHGKNYTHPVHESTRRKNWEAARAKIEKHNAEAAAGLHTYTMGENHLSDLHDHEKQQLTGYILPQNLNREFAPFQVDERAVPASVDLRNSTCMPPIENQGQCGSCWAFSASGSLMYALCKKTGKLVRLSEQQLVDCSTANHGCNGGSYRRAWTYVKNATGQASLTAYPYTAMDGTCKFTKSMVVGTDTGYVDVQAKNETAIRVAVANVGAVSAALQVISSFMSYKSGVYYDSTCPTDGTTMNHAVVIVGYGTLNGTNYWIIRNSWGTSWGQQGYVFIKRGVNACNIESTVAYPTV